MEFAGYLPPDEFWAMNDRMDEEVRSGAIRLPLFSMEDQEGPVMLGSWQLDGSEGSVSHGDGFSHADPLVEVITTPQDSRACQEPVACFSGNPPHPGRASTPGRSL
ncbi:hypothetical protein [Arthrobacter sp. yr096]|uniref:hypothetical protein n=1 Tax=Arthrobacter sp. yr096 TaxID=1761750 RepID=UPI000AA21877|nr:hypothetical protein [Arthrobacter sp. yr096]